MQLYQPRNLAFWVYALLVALGTFWLLQEWADGWRRNSATLIVAVVYFAAYSVPFWMYIRHNDRYESEPAKLCAAGFVWGATAATFGLSIHANEALASIYSKAFGFEWANDWDPGASAPLIEETAKGAGLVLLITMAPRLNRTAYDGAVIGACIGLGFQIIENITYVMNNASRRSGIASDAIDELFIRSLTGIVSHVVYSAIMGMGIVWLWGRPDEPRRIGRGLAFVCGAIVLHAGWNTMKALGDRSDIYGALAPLIVGIASFVLLFAGLSVAALREREWMRALLVPELEQGTITSEELEALAGPRRARKKFAKACGGRAERRRRRHLFNAATDLAEQIARHGGDESPAVARARRELTRIRGDRPPQFAPRPPAQTDEHHDVQSGD